MKDFTKAEGRPVISVCIPVYNGMPWIGSTVRSVLAQTFQDLEIIIRDDRSRDDTVPFLRQRFGDDKRILICQNDETLDVGGQYNQLFCDARGEYIVKLDADDLWHPEFLERCLQEMTDTVDVVAAGWEWLFTETGAKSRPQIQMRIQEGIVERPLQTILESNPFSLCFMLWRRTLLPQIQRDGRFVLETESCDWECQLRLALAGARFKYLPDTLGQYRIHETNRSSRPNAQSDSVLCDVLPYWGAEISAVIGRTPIQRLALRHLRNHVRHALAGRIPLSHRTMTSAVKLITGWSHPKLPATKSRSPLPRSDA